MQQELTIAGMEAADLQRTLRLEDDSSAAFQQQLLVRQQVRGSRCQQRAMHMVMETCDSAQPQHVPQAQSTSWAHSAHAQNSPLLYCFVTILVHSSSSV
jgi:hypothetical protein